MANKTKNELLVEIDELNRKIIEYEQDIVKYEQLQACINASEEYKLIYDNYVKAGFTEEQSFDLVKITLERTINDFTRDIRNSHRYNGYRRY